MMEQKRESYKMIQTPLVAHLHHYLLYCTRRTVTIVSMVNRSIERDRNEAAPVRIRYPITHI